MRLVAGETVCLGVVVEVAVGFGSLLDDAHYLSSVFARFKCCRRVALLFPPFLLGSS